MARCNYFEPMPFFCTFKPMPFFCTFEPSMLKQDRVNWPKFIESDFFLLLDWLLSSSSSSSSCRATGTDISGPLSLLLPIVHRPRQVFRTTSCILTELLYVLNVAICIVCFHFSSFCCLRSVADFSNTEARAPVSVGRAPFFTRAKSDAVYVCGLSVGHGYLSMAVFILIYRSHSYRWVAVVPRSNWRSWPLRLEIHTSRTRLGIAWDRQSVYLHTVTSIMLLPMGT